MRRGSYTKVNFGDFRVAKFVPHLYHKAGGGCGANALALLTGVDPYTFREREDWKPQYMTKVLREKGFKTAEITKRNVTNFDSPESPLCNDHVILASVKMFKNNASWVVLHNSIFYHNFEISVCKSMDLLNQPIISAFLVVHPDWRPTCILEPDFRREFMEYAHRAIGQLSRRTK